MLTIVDRAILRPLPYGDPGSLVAAFHRNTVQARDDKATGAEVERWSNLTGVFSSVAFAWDAQYTLTSSSPAIALRAFQFSTNMFSTLGVHPALGRTFASGDEVPGADHVTVLSDHLWRTAFNAAPNVVGRIVRLDDAPYTIIGVMRPSFAHPDATIDLWTPLAMPAGLASNNSLHVFNVVGRLRPGLSIAAARGRLGNDVHLETLRDLYLGPARPVIWVLQGAVLLLVLIAAANVANLVLAHATTARREVALRRALGASSGRVTRSFVTQGFILAAAGCIGGIVVADVGLFAVPASLRQLFGAMPADWSHGVSAAAVVASVGLSIALAFAIGLAMSAGSRSTPGTALRSDSRGGAASRGVTQLRGALIVAQIAVSLVLLASSSLLVRSYLNLERRSLGFETANRLTFLLQPQANRYADLARMSSYVDQVLARIRAVPGVSAVAAASAVPLTGTDARRRLVLPGATDSAGANVIHYRVVSPGYFATMGIPLRAGRALTSADRAGAPDVALVNETLARTHWPSESPIGKTVTIAGRTDAIRRDDRRCGWRRET